MPRPAIPGSKPGDLKFSSVIAPAQNIPLAGPCLPAELKNFIEAPAARSRRPKKGIGLPTWIVSLVLATSLFLGAGRCCSTWQRIDEAKAATVVPSPTRQRSAPRSSLVRATPLRPLRRGHGAPRGRGSRSQVAGAVHCRQSFRHAAFEHVAEGRGADRRRTRPAHRRCSWFHGNSVARTPPIQGNPYRPRFRTPRVRDSRLGVSPHRSPCSFAELVPLRVPDKLCRIAPWRSRFGNLPETPSEPRASKRVEPGATLLL